MARRETARKLAIAIAAGRIAIGCGVLLATRPSLRALGFPDTDASGHALARLAGGRDASDALTLGLAGRRNAELRLAGVGGVASGGAAALAGAWAWRGLGS